MPRPVRLRLIIALAAVTAIAASIYALGSRPEPKFSASLTSLSFSTNSVQGGSTASLSIAFSGTPVSGDYVRLRPSDDITGWSVSAPGSGNYAFNNSDMTGPYIQVPLYVNGSPLTSPVVISIETVNPDDDADTRVTGLLNDTGTQRITSFFTIIHH